MSDARQFAPAESATSAACAQYLMRSALDATQFVHRHQQVVRAVARGQISPQQVDNVLTTADWGEVQRDVVAAISAFAQTLAQHALLPHEYASPSSDEVVANGPSDADRPHVDVEPLSSLLARLAHPDVTTGARRRALTRLNQSAANRTLGSVATAWFAMLESVSSASLRAMNPALLTILRSAHPIGYDREVVELAGPIKTRVTTQLDIENTLDRAAALRCTCQEVRRADGVGPAFTPSMTVTPAQQVLGARAEGGVALSLWLDDAQFDAQAMYVGALSVESDGGTRLTIPLRITTA